MSDLFKLNWLDVGKALLMAFLTTFLGTIYLVFQAGNFPTWPEIGAAAMAGLAAAVAYLVKNFFTNSQNKLGTPEPK